jgi:RimJ/RimL family protein N-acetyltransferase
MDTPSLARGDIRLRPTAQTDEAGIAAAGRDPDIRRMPWFGAGFEDSWAGPWVRRAIDEWAAGCNRVFSIVDAEGRYVGSVNVGPLRDGAVEISYWVLPDARRKGVATMAVSAVLPWTRDTHPDARIWAKTRLDNTASQRVLAKCGFVERRRADAAYFDWPG